ncbi:hypothetical protein [Desulfobotulus mexicanus]|uniref:Lipoprotein n=1 Tax=Desulfobotulus mexicanus TaxID=2586642 RepID=A0A5Q4VC20_9BACT|nr:hypothetical protein [Desulfobotulus mexicanus]TYT75229.1 hypothetical protein FIM25_05855 [Desulfobotulus mexicanus]
MKNITFNKNAFVLAIVTLFFVVGCSHNAPKEYHSDLYENIQYHHYFPQSFFGSGQNNQDSVALKKIDHFNRGGYNHAIFKDLNEWAKLSNKGAPLNEHNAFTKRKAAIFLGRGVISYQFANFNYTEKKEKCYSFFCVPGKPYVKPEFLIAMKFDAVSNVLYNVSYIFSVPAKIIHSTRVAEGPIEWMKTIVLLLFSGFIAFFMIFIGAIIGFICHPFQSLANLLISLDGGYQTHLLYSLLDLFWNAILLSLWDIIYLFFK